MDIFSAVLIFDIFYFVLKTVFKRDSFSSTELDTGYGRIIIWQAIMVLSGVVVKMNHLKGFALSPLCFNILFIICCLFLIYSIFMMWYMKKHKIKTYEDLFLKNKMDKSTILFFGATLGIGISMLIYLFLVLKLIVVLVIGGIF